MDVRIKGFDLIRLNLITNVRIKEFDLIRINYLKGSDQFNNGCEDEGI